MSYSQIETHEPAALVETGSVPHGGRRQALFECLIVTYVDQRGGMLKRAAFDGGWEPLLCRDVETAATQGARRRLQLAIVDFEGAPKPTLPRLRRLSESLTTPVGPLVVVCGHKNDPAQEVWARQLGVWLYLPAIDEQRDLAPLFGDALAIAQKTAGVQRASGVQKTAESLVHQNDFHDGQTVSGDQHTRKSWSQR